MNVKKKILAESRLYVIIGPADAAKLGLPLDEIARRAYGGGADLVQLRDKSFDFAQDESRRAEFVATARRIAAIARRAGKLFIVNDYPDVAAQSGADGVHLGQDDISVADARSILGPDKIVGQSTHSPDEALQAEAFGVDYIGYGPVFATPTKPDYRAVSPDSIPAVAEKVSIPFFAIGGIDRSNLREIWKKGARRIAVVRAAVSQADVRESVSELKSILNSLEAPLHG